MNLESDTKNDVLPAGNRETNLDSVIKIAVMAVGGQGGGVLTQWIETLGRGEGYAVQATSVAGVAQRTGATIYYIEMFDPAACTSQAGNAVNRPPVFSLAPAEGDVDILIAAELMEAGRAVMRGFVTPYNTTLIASTHRAHAVSEKMVPGFGISDPQPVIDAAQEHSLRAIMLDMEAIAVAEGSVISASLFGALAASRVLPFETSAFESAIRSGSRGVEKSLRAFHRAMEDVAQSEGADAVDDALTEVMAKAPIKTNQPTAGTDQTIQTPSAYEPVAGPESEQKLWRALQRRVEELPQPVREMAAAGLAKVVDYQDTAYGEEYLDRLYKLLAHDTEARRYQLLLEAARHIANAMAYDDVIRVADLKTRESRFVRIRQEMQTTQAQRLKLTEYMHPRGEELMGMLPLAWAIRIKSMPILLKLMDRVLSKGKRWRSDRISGFLPLYMVAGLRKWRKRSLRHSLEVDHLEAWLEKATSYLPHNYELAVEVLKCRRLIKGYSDTHARGQSKFSRIIDALPLLEKRDDAAETISKLREAALSDEKGIELDSMLESL